MQCSFVPNPKKDNVRFCFQTKKKAAVASSPLQGVAVAAAFRLGEEPLLLRAYAARRDFGVRLLSVVEGRSQPSSN